MIRVSTCRAVFAAAVSATLLAHLPAAYAQKLFVANSSNNTIGEYATSGATINSAPISLPGSPGRIAVSGSDVFVDGGGYIGEYTTTGYSFDDGPRTGERHHRLAGFRGTCRSTDDLDVHP
jgi:hypothetical protein